MTTKAGSMPEEEPVRPFAVMQKNKCTGCSGIRFERMPRHGFFQEAILPFFGLYPWRCVACGKTVNRTNRSIPSRRLAR